MHANTDKSYQWPIDDVRYTFVCVCDVTHSINESKFENSFGVMKLIGTDENLNNIISNIIFSDLITFVQSTLLLRSF